MIEKMKVVHIVAAASEKTALLDRLRTLGIVHFAEKASADQRQLERFAELYDRRLVTLLRVGEQTGGGEAGRVGRFLPGGAAGAEGPGLRHPRLPDG